MSRTFLRGALLHSLSGVLDEANTLTQVGRLDGERSGMFQPQHWESIYATGHGFLMSATDPKADFYTYIPAIFQVS